MNRAPSPRSVTEILEDSSLEFLNQSQECIEKFSTWMKLYTASQILLMAMEEKRVVPALIEICSNLLACEELAIVEIEDRQVHFLGEEGLSTEQREILLGNPALLEKRIKTNTLILIRKKDTAIHTLDSLKISAVVPLWKDQQSSAAMFLLRLLPQRTEFDVEDQEVLQLLSQYAGPCLRSQLRGRS